MISRRGFIGRLSALSAAALCEPGAEASAAPAARQNPRRQSGRSGPAESGLGCGNGSVRISVAGEKSNLWALEDLASGQVFRFQPPVFPIQGGAVEAILTEIRPERAPQKFNNGVSEFSFEGRLAGHPSLTLGAVFQVGPESPVVRFRYSLASAAGFAFDPREGTLSYCGISFAGLDRVTEVQLSNWNALLHSNTLATLNVPESWFDDGLGTAGPILVGAAEGKGSLLVAYEHGSQMPDTFLRFALTPERTATLTGVKGNYVPGQTMRKFETVWMEAAVSGGGVDDLAGHFRNFVCTGMDVNGGSRDPYLFYNTWNFQERDKWWYGKDYYSSYNTEKMLAEIAVAHRLGLEIFVMDAGWFEKTGDWEPNRARFPDGLKAIKAELDRCGMKLGLWFNPTMAAVSSKILAAHRGNICSWEGKQAEAGDIWGSEASYPMCLVSEYSDAYAETVIRVARETGARYFIWDAVAQYGCDSPNHWHGSSANTQQERSDSYAFQLPLQLVRIVEKVRSVYPEIVFDFDVTEDGRAVGLSFLSAGRFCLANNGPYLADYDQPHQPGAQNDNLFFFPGPARTWICRKPLDYDSWIPSNLLLTHYYPDDPVNSQLVNLATLVLGQNGIWGSLSTVSEPGIDWMSQVLRRYKQIRSDVMLSEPVVSGSVSSSYEVHEKINRLTGRGVIVLFSTTPGKMIYVSQRRPAREIWASSGTAVRFDSEGHAVIHNDMQSGAAIVLFGVK